MKSTGIVLLSLIVGLCACKPKVAATENDKPASSALAPVIVSEATPHDTDDPAIWIHPTDPSLSLIVGTDKDTEGGLYVFNLAGQIQEDKVVLNLRRPNNVDIQQGVQRGDSIIDIAVCTEREARQLRVFSMPDMTPIDGGGLPVFEGEPAGDFQAPMGIALYQDPRDHHVYAIVGRKEGPATGYLWQYQLTVNTEGQIEHELVRRFGAFSGNKEIEAILVDDALGHVYYSDEQVGVRQYYAHPDSPDVELSLFATDGIADDHEGLSLWPTSDSTGYILLSDQQANEFHVYQREVLNHPLVSVLPLSTVESDGSDLYVGAMSDTFPSGIFVAMSDDRTFQFYDLGQLSLHLAEK